MELIVILDNIRSAQNVGAIMRTCDGVGVSKLYLTGITPHPPHNKILKTALGADEFVSWEYSKSTVEVINKLKQDGFTTIAVEQAKGSEPYYKFNPKSSKLVFIFGNEITGVEPGIIEMCDNIVELPMAGKKNSLNVATTVGIILYHFKFNGRQ